jgi:hypothetical protein
MFCRDAFLQLREMVFPAGRLWLLLENGCELVRDIIHADLLAS